MSRNQAFARFVHGKRILLYQNGMFNQANMRRALVNKDDVMAGIRRTLSTEDLEAIDKIYMERNGEISLVKKKADA